MGPTRIPIAQSRCVQRMARALPNAGEVVLRPLPYPYRALLAICSDLDETPDRRVYSEIMRFLNTTKITAMGLGVGLEVGNTIYFDMPPEQFAYWNTDDLGREMVRNLMRSGHIDCLHSFGDLATTRDHAARALDELSRHECRLEVWVDHGVAPSNFGADIMAGCGDIPGHPVYHADLTCAFGIKYVWRGRVTSVTGQNVGPRLSGIFALRHPGASGRTLAKEAAKQCVSWCGDGKYSMHRPNRVLRADRLRNGQAVFEFLRCNPHWKGPGEGATASGLTEVLTSGFLDRLVRRGGVCVLYTHLGKVRETQVPFNKQTVAVLRRLADRYSRGDILVTTTRRALGFCRAMQGISLSTECVEGETVVNVSTGDGAGGCASALADSDFDGLTVYTPDPDRTRLRLNGKVLHTVIRNGPDHTGRSSVSLPWPRLEFPDL